MADGAAPTRLTAPRAAPWRRPRRLVAVIALALPPALGVAQDWSGGSLRSARPLALPAGYRADLVATGARLPQDLALDPPDAAWLLTQSGAPGGAGALVRLSLATPRPVEVASLPAIAIPFSPDPARFRVGSLARHPATGDLYVAERLGRHIFRVTPGGAVTLYARGAHLLSDSRTLAFDPEGRLVVLDFVGRPVVADVAPRDPLGALPDTERVEGPLLYRLRIDEPLPLPRNLEYARPTFPPAALRRPGTRLPRYVGVAALPSGDLILSGVSGTIDRLTSAGALRTVATLSAGRVVGAGPAGELYAVDFLGGRLVRIAPDGAVEPFVEGLARPAAVAVGPDGSVLVAEDTGRVLAIRPHQ